MRKSRRDTACEALTLLLPCRRPWRCNKRRESVRPRGDASYRWHHCESRRSPGPTDRLPGSLQTQKQDARQPGSQDNAGERRPWQRAPTAGTPPGTGTADPEQHGASLSLGLPVTRAPQRPRQGRPCCPGVSRRGTRVSTSAHAPASLPGLTAPEVG